MRKNQFFRKALANTVLILSLFPVQAATAASVYWDADGAYGGDGIWSASDLTWNTATDGTGTVRAWITNDTANFRSGESGSVTVSGTMTALALSFGVSPNGNSAFTLNGGIVDLRQASFGNAINNRGSNTINSDLYLFGSAGSENNRQRIVSNSGTFVLANVRNNAGAAATGTQSLSLENYSGTINITGNITRAGTAKTMELHLGGTTTSNSATYALGGNNTGLNGTATLYRGNLLLNNSAALGGSTGTLTVANANTGTATADTAVVLIGTSGASIGRNVTFATLGSDTSDLRTIGSNITSGTATYTGTITLQSFAASGTGSSLRVTAAAGGSTVFSGNITDGGNSVTVTKVGAGTVEFNRATGMSYDGGTVVSTGTLLVNNTSGSGTGTGAVTVEAGGTLGGSGIISGATTIRGTHSPGNSPGVQTFGSSLTYENGASVLFELTANTSTQGDPTRLFDQILVGGNLDFTGAISLSLDFDISGSSVDWSDGFWEANQSWLVYDVGGTTSNFGNLQLTLSNWLDGDGSLFNDVLPGSSFSLAQSGNDIYLSYTAVPEPSTAVILAVGLTMLGLRRRSAL